MKAKFLIIDFINTLFFFGIIGFTITYFIVGDRLIIFTRFLRSLIPFSYYGLLFLYKVRNSADDFEKFRKEDTLDEIIVYFSDLDIIKDLVIITGIPIFIIGLAFLGPQVDIADILQAVLTFTIMLIWHLILFKRKEQISRLRYATNFDRIKDSIVIFLLPIFIVSISLIANRYIDMIDMLQSGIPFLVMYFWRKILFKQEA